MQRPGTIMVQRDGKRCEVTAKNLKFSNANVTNISTLTLKDISFVDSDGPLVGLFRTSIGDAASDIRYWTVRIDPASCRMRVTSLGNPDNLIEIGWSPEGHWWIVGSIETTLLQSKDGEHWTAAVLSPETSQLVSAYVSNDHEIWLAANDGRIGQDTGPSIVHSDDGGHTWVPIKWGDPVLKRLPPIWFEGQMRVNAKAIN
ncbi:WD40/YVTN/BNR-like repeat-containing protein [Paraburkholderia silviterrae]|uniref:Uncharacterized protein n=1 Tax=Paraburkholderia silviterrae TaxID=2528715 RepID=A0A4R5M4P1_9BURK|nr:hypothetical protein [Paraburkholderia silviterrae]TDG20353.1 hypothetical protein EYW47_26245 [Paraburkholderia silviterrae]